VVSVRQLRPSASALPSAKRVHIVSAPRVSVRALGRCHRRTRLASHRAEGRQWTTDGQPHASLLHNAAFCKVPGRSLASSLCGRAPLRALRVLQNRRYAKCLPWAARPGHKSGAPSPLPFCVRGAPRGVRASQFSQALRAWFLVSGLRPVLWCWPPPAPLLVRFAHIARALPVRPPRGLPQGAGVLPVPGVGGSLPGRRALRARRPGTPQMQSHGAPNSPQIIRKHPQGIRDSLRHQKKKSADFLSNEAKTNEHGPFRTSSISCPQRCARFFGTSEMGQFIRKTSAFGLRHMPALRVGILMRSWSSSAALLIKDWGEAAPRQRAPKSQSAISKAVTGFQSS